MLDTITMKPVSLGLAKEFVLIGCIIKRHQLVSTFEKIIVIQSTPFIVFKQIVLVLLHPLII